jgi:hypothetical protein
MQDDQGGGEGAGTNHHVIPAKAGIRPNVIPAKAGTHVAGPNMGPRFRGDDGREGGDDSTDARLVMGAQFVMGAQCVMGAQLALPVTPPPRNSRSSNTRRTAGPCDRGR